MSSVHMCAQGVRNCGEGEGRGVSKTQGHLCPYPRVGTGPPRLLSLSLPNDVASFAPAGLVSVCPVPRNLLAHILLFFSDLLLYV